MTTKELHSLKPGTLIVVRGVKNLDGIILEVEKIGFGKEDMENLSIPGETYRDMVNFDENYINKSYCEWLRSERAVCKQPGVDNKNRWAIYKKSMYVLKEAE